MIPDDDLRTLIPQVVSALVRRGADFASAEDAASLRWSARGRRGRVTRPVIRGPGW